MTDLVGAVLERKRGDSGEDVVFAKDKITKLPIDITGFSFKLTVSNKADRNAVGAVQLAQSIGVVFDGPNGEVRFPWTALQADLPKKTYFYDVQMTTNAGKIETIAKNKYLFYSDITP